MQAYKYALLATLLGASAIAVAQQPAGKPAAPQAAAARTTATDIGPSNVVQAAAAIAEMIDGGRIAEVWDGSSPVSQKQIDRKKFVDTITAQRKSLGGPVSRHWTAVTRQIVNNDKNVPSGYYVSARFETRFGSRTVSELFSFRFDDDKTWRLSGYSIN